jgi:transglutaminase/protease-like cytokinesis protein 3
VTWTSSNNNVATVDNTGKVTAKAAGTAIITVTTADGSKSASYTVTVTAAPVEPVAVTGVTLNKSEASLVVGNTETLTPTINPSNATNRNVTWTSSNNNVATVDNTGKVTAKAAGTAIITVTTADSSKTASCTLTVSRRSSSGSGGNTTSGTITPTTPVIPPVNQSTDVPTETTKVNISISNGTASVGGDKVELSVKPYIQNGRTIVGIRDVASLLQIEAKNIIWDAKTKTIFIKTKDKNIEFYINQKYAVVDGKKVDLDVAPQVKDGRTVLPIALIARIMGINMQYDAATKEANFAITK